MAIPKVTIRINGAEAGTTQNVAQSAAEDSLHMVYLQGVRTLGDADQRHQMVVFPPQTKALGIEHGDGESVMVMFRTQEFEGNRSKWFFSLETKISLDGLIQDLQSQDGYDFNLTVASPLEWDDFQKAWSKETPHKALRHIDKALAPFNTTVK